MLRDAIVGNVSHAAVDQPGDSVAIHKVGEGIPVDWAGSQGFDAPAHVLVHGCAAEGQEEVEFAGKTR